MVYLVGIMDRDIMVVPIYPADYDMHLPAHIQVTLHSGETDGARHGQQS